jgi:hypothetical protein
MLSIRDIKVELATAFAFNKNPKHICLYTILPYNKGNADDAN